MGSEQVILEALKTSPYALFFYWLLNYTLKATAERERKFELREERLIGIIEDLTEKVEIMGSNLEKLTIRVNDLISCQNK